MCIMYADGDVQRLADGLGVGLQVIQWKFRKIGGSYCVICAIGLRDSLITACNERADNVWDVGARVTSG